MKVAEAITVKRHFSVRVASNAVKAGRINS